MRSTRALRARRRRAALALAQSAPRRSRKPPRPALQPDEPAPQPPADRTVLRAQGLGRARPRDRRRHRLRRALRVAAARGVRRVPRQGRRRRHRSAVSPEAFNGLQGGSMIALFTTPDCSGNSMFADALVAAAREALRDGAAVGLAAAGRRDARLAVGHRPLAGPRSSRPPARCSTRQWNDSNTCAPIPPPGYTVPAGSGVGGFPMHRVEDLLAKYTPPVLDQLLKQAPKTKPAHRWAGFRTWSGRQDLNL